ncbi:hypothetical protein ACFL4O_00800 [bacterium]
MKKFILFLLLLILAVTHTYTAKKTFAKYGSNLDKKSSIVSLSIHPLSKLNITDADLNINLSGTEAQTAYDTGYVDGDINKPILTVCANTDWRLIVKIAIKWNHVNGYKKEDGDLQLKVVSSSGHQTGFSSFTPLSKSNQEIAVNTSGANNETYNCQYRILLDWEKDIPGTYTCTLKYTLTTLGS